MNDCLVWVIYSDHNLAYHEIICLTQKKRKDETRGRQDILNKLRSIL